MIAGFFHQGSGLGNQLFRYITVRTLAEELGYEWGMIAPHLYKGASFMPLDMGKVWHESYRIDSAGKVILDITKPWEENTFYYNPEINYTKDESVVDGSFEDVKYWGGNLDKISKWLRIERRTPPDDTCIIGFRGGEYATVPDLFLPREYWERAINIMKEAGIKKFEVHTDDTALARSFFPDCVSYHDIALNWTAVRFAKHAIIANSSFYIMPRLLRHHEGDALTIAPRYWNRYNTKKWDYPQNYYKQFTQI